MRSSLYILVIAVAMSIGGCFSPTYPEGIQCSQSRRCPGAQTCDGTGICRLGVLDAGNAIDAPLAADANEDASAFDAACEFVPGSQTFDYTGTIESFVIPDCVTSITIEAWGASGGDSYAQADVDGGKGARMKGVFAVVPSNALKILVGGRGADTILPPHDVDFEQGGGTGGGGSFVATSGDVAMLVAGGGGGCSADSSSNGGDGVVEEPGQAGGGAGGEPGLGGITKIDDGDGHEGTGGGGFNGPGIGASVGTAFFGGTNYPGSEFTAGGAGGVGGESSRNGGFGGGGSAGFTGGGGGGYSGGGAGAYQTTAGGGGGGGSFNAGTEQDNGPGVQVGNGSIQITW